MRGTRAPYTCIMMKIAIDFEIGASRNDITKNLPNSNCPTPEAAPKTHAKTSLLIPWFVVMNSHENVAN